METDWWNYVQRVIGDDTATQAADRAGFDKSAFTRWKRGDKAHPEFVVKFAREYGANVLEALVASRFLDPDEAALHEVTPTLHEMFESLDDRQLARELLRRIEERAANDGPKGERVGSARDTEAATTETRRDKAAIGERIARTADARKRR